MRNYEDYLIEKLKDPEYAEEYLNASIEAFLEDNDTKALMITFEHLTRANHSISGLAKNAGISRQHLYRIFDNEAIPNFATVLQILKALGFKIEAKRISDAA